MFNIHGVKNRQNHSKLWQKQPLNCKFNRGLHWRCDFSKVRADRAALLWHSDMLAKPLPICDHFPPCTFIALSLFPTVNLVKTKALHEWAEERKDTSKCSPKAAFTFPPAAVGGVWSTIHSLTPWCEEHVEHWPPCLWGCCSLQFLFWLLNMLLSNQHPPGML